MSTVTQSYLLKRLQIFSHYYVQLPCIGFNFLVIDHPNISQVVTGLKACCNGKNREFRNLNKYTIIFFEGGNGFVISKFIRKWGLRAENKAQLFTIILREKFSMMFKMNFNWFIKFGWDLDLKKAAYWLTISRKDKLTWRKKLDIYLDLVWFSKWWYNYFYSIPWHIEHLLLIRSTEHLYNGS